MLRVKKIPTLLGSYTNYKAKLILEDGSLFTGRGFGYPKEIVGEVVFNTGMVGYTESLTDPSYRGQILCMTYPLIGNYGVSSMEIMDDYGLPKYFESKEIQVRGLIVHELSPISSHWSCIKTLDQWLYEENIPAIYKVDTREIAKKIRVKGVMNGALSVSKASINESKLFGLMKKQSYDVQNFMPEVSIPTAREYAVKDSKGPIVIIDTGTKFSIIRNVLRTGYSAIVVPWNTSFQEIKTYNPKGVVISNGPGDPKMCQTTIKTAAGLIMASTPTLGICLGNQILALAAGANTYKLKYGHRGQNKPCINKLNNQAYVTSQNHGYGIEPESLKNTEFKIWFSNADDETIEGIVHSTKPIVAVQFHPEASPGPFDCMFIFDQFAEIIERHYSRSKQSDRPSNSDVQNTNSAKYSQDKITKKWRKFAKK
jgi:carbamoyl-phosphate synthase small subunit